MSASDPHEHSMRDVMRAFVLDLCARCEGKQPSDVRDAELAKMRAIVGLPVEVAEDA